MKIYRDTRENKNHVLDFQIGDGISEVIDMKLPYADYAAAWEDKNGKHVEFMPLFFERKGSLSDLYGTLGSGMERFLRELARAKEDGIQIIIIVGACFAEIKNGHEHSTIGGESILKTLHTLWTKHSVPYVFCNDERDMRDTIVHFFNSIGKNFKPSMKQKNICNLEVSNEKRKQMEEVEQLEESAGDDAEEQ